MKYITSIMLVTIIMSCGIGNKVKEPENKDIYKKWELSVLNDEQINENSSIYLELTQDNKVNGFIGCNQLIGSYTIKGSQIKFNQLGVTSMACPEMEMTLERKVLEILNTADHFTIENGKLLLSTGNKAPFSTFYEMSDNKIVNNYWKLKKLGDNTVQMAANQEREQYFILRTDGSISGFAGCNQFNGQYELTNENQISINKNMAISLKACPDVEVDESAFLKVFELTDNYTIKGETLILHGNKGESLAVFEVVYF